MNLLRFKNLCSNKDIRAGLHAETLPLMSVSQTRGVLPRSELTGEALGRAESLEHYKLCGPGDIVLNRMSAYNGAVGVAKEPGLVSPDYLVLRPRVAACPEYLGYLIKSHWFVGEMTSRLRGIGSADNAGVRTPRIGLGELNSIEVRELSFDEQRSIVRYLDRETAEIDEFVAESEKLITLLNERRAAVITQAVTKGLDPTAPMKDTGIEWLGKVPSHWGIAKLGLWFEVVLGKMLDEAKFPGTVGSVLPYVRAANIGDKALSLENVNEMPFSPNELAKFNLRKGDLLVVEGGSVGQNVVLSEDMPGWGFQKTVNRVRPRIAGASTAFLGFAIDMLRYRGVIDMLSAGSTIAHLTAEKLGQLILAWPPVSEQDKISDFIAKQTAKIDEAIDTAREAIALAKERRQALISAAVTGKIDVRSAP